MSDIERQEISSPQPDYVSRRIVEYLRLVRGGSRLEELASNNLEAQQELEQLRYEATTDTLTRLPHRGFFFRYLLPALEARGVRKCRCLKTDLANLKDFNRTDIWGDDGGDAVVAATATILKALAEEFGATPIRFHGDTFILVFEGLPGISKVVDAGASYLRQVDREALVQGRVLNQPLKDYSKDPPTGIKLSREGLQGLEAIADGQYADLLLPTRATFTVLTLDLTQGDKQIKAALQAADERCTHKKKLMMAELRKKYPDGFNYLLRKE